MAMVWPWNMDEPKDLEGQDPSPSNPDDGGNGNPPANPEGADEPGGGEGVEDRLNRAERIISDLKKTAGVNSVKELEGVIAKGKAPAQPPKPKPPEANDDRGQYVTRDEIALFNAGYSPEEIAVAQKLAPGKPLNEAVQDPTAQAAINGIRAARKAQGASPEPSSRIPVHQNKTFGELKPNERQAAYGQTLDKLVGKARQSGGRTPGR